MGTVYFSLFDMSNKMEKISKAVLAFSTFVKGYCQSFLTPGNGFLIQVLLYTCTGPLKKLEYLFQGRLSFPLRILKHLNFYFYFNLKNLNFTDVSQCTQSK